MKRGQFWINLAVYLIVILGLLYFNFPFSSKTGRQPKSTVQFVYQQF